MNKKQSAASKSKIVRHTEPSPISMAGIAVNMKVSPQSNEKKETILPIFSIFCYYKEDKEISVIQLTDKTKIAVNMPFAEFCHKFHRAIRRNSIADFTSATGIVPLTAQDRKHISDIFNVNAKQDIALSEIDDHIIILHGYGKNKEKANTIAIAKSDIRKLKPPSDASTTPFLYIKDWEEYNSNNLSIEGCRFGPNLLHEEFNKLEDSFKNISKEKRLIVDFRQQCSELSSTEIKMTAKAKEIIQKIKR